MERSAEYPEKIYQFNGEILIYEEMFQCGLIQIYVENLPSVACFFQFNHIFGEISPAHGSPIQLCARMYNSDHQIPYIAAIIWAPGNTPNTSLVEMLMNNSISPQEEQAECLTRFLDFFVIFWNEKFTNSQDKKQFLSDRI